MGAFKDRLRKQAGDSRARETAHDPTHPARPTYEGGKEKKMPERKPFRMRDRPIVKRIDGNE
jgi:hypothetical protein